MPVSPKKRRDKLDELRKFLTKHPKSDVADYAVALLAWSEEDAAEPNDPPTPPGGPPKP